MEKDKAMQHKRQINEAVDKWNAELTAIELFKIIVSKFESEPMSAQCFDLKIVKKAIITADKLKIYE